MVQKFFLTWKIPSCTERDFVGIMLVVCIYTRNTINGGNPSAIYRRCIYNLQCDTRFFLKKTKKEEKRKIHIIYSATLAFSLRNEKKF